MNTSNFVSELVEMAKAVERVPQLEAELAKAHDDCDTALRSLQSRELSIIEYKRQIEELTAKNSALEVARDDAEMRFLELDEKVSHVLGLVKGMASVAGQVIGELDPPKPQPEATASRPEPAIPSNGQAPITDQERKEIEAIPMQGQGATDPTVHGASPTQTGETTGVGQTENVSSLIGHEPSPNSGPYSGLLYHSYPGFVTRSNWLAGGGTEADYDWHPEPTNSW